MRSYLSLLLLGLSQVISLNRGHLKLTGFVETYLQDTNFAQLDSVLLPIAITKGTLDGNSIIHDDSIVVPPLSTDCNNGKCDAAWIISSG